MHTHSQRWRCHRSPLGGRATGACSSLGLRVERERGTVVAATAVCYTCHRAPRVHRRMSMQGSRRVTQCSPSPFPRSLAIRMGDRRQRPLQSNPNGQALWWRGTALSNVITASPAWRSHDGKRKEETLQKGYDREEKTSLTRMEALARGSGRRGMEERERMKMSQRSLILHATLIHGAAAVGLLLLLLRLESLVHVPERKHGRRAGRTTGIISGRPQQRGSPCPVACVVLCCAESTDMIPTPTSSPPCRLP